MCRFKVLGVVDGTLDVGDWLRCDAGEPRARGMERHVHPFNSDGRKEAQPSGQLRLDCVSIEGSRRVAAFSTGLRTGVFRELIDQFIPPDQADRR